MLPHLAFFFFYRSSGDLNSSPHIHKTNALHNEPSFPSPDILIYFWNPIFFNMKKLGVFFFRSFPRYFLGQLQNVFAFQTLHFMLLQLC